MTTNALLINNAVAALGISKAALARRLRVHPTTLVRWANGTRPMPPATRQLLTVAAEEPDAVWHAMKKEES